MLNTIKRAVKLSIMLPISNMEIQDFKNKQIGTIIKTGIGTFTDALIDNNMSAENKSKKPKIFTIFYFIGLRTFLQEIWKLEGITLH